MVNVLEKTSGIILLILCTQFSLTMFLNLLFIIIYFTHMVRLLISLVLRHYKSSVLARGQFASDFASSGFFRLYFSV